MKKILTISILFMAILLFAGCGGGNDDNKADGKNNGGNETQEEIVSIADEFLTLYVEGKYEEAVQFFDETMSEQLPPEGLKQTAESVSSQLGKFIDKEYKKTTEADGYDVVIFSGTYEASDVIFTVTFNDEKEIAGFLIQ